MKCKIIIKVNIDGIGKITHEHFQEFDDSENVFGRILEYHQYMYKTFPKCSFEIVSCEEVDENSNKKRVR